MKKVFFVKRKLNVDWNEYDSCVIVADSIDEVNEILDNRLYEQDQKYLLENGSKYLDYADDGIDDRDITEINLEDCPSMLICSSFNAA